jgi:RNA polymerase sigma factor (TIGR02999 family)
MTRPSRSVTELLLAFDGPSSEATALLFEQLYDELRAVAAARLRAERAGHTLSATALVNEAYLKLADLDRLDWKNRAHFFAIASRAMRRILVNHARDRAAEKRGGGAEAVTLLADMAKAGGETMSWDTLLTTEAALSDLAERNERQARVAEIKLFGGATHEEIAEALDVSVPTVERDWRLARAFVGRALSA